MWFRREEMELKNTLISQQKEQIIRVNKNNKNSKNILLNEKTKSELKLQLKSKTNQMNELKELYQLTVRYPQ